jgi:acetolactate synthase I/II/III large subunit
MNTTDTRTGAELLVDALHVNNVDMAFGVPGESYLAVLDALYASNQIDMITCRQEGGAAMMADAYGKLTGRPGICFVTRAPGATNASAGVHIAYQDSTPMILLIGQVARNMMDREAFQEVDYRRMFGEMSKWTAQIDDPSRMQEYISHAFHVATSGRPGPVVLALPEDMLTEHAVPSEITAAAKIEAHPGPDAMAEFKDLLSNAERPMVILGGSGWDEQSCLDFQTFAEANALPVACAFRYQYLFDNTHDLYAGDIGIGINPALSQLVKDSDVILALGPRLGEMTTGGYSLIDIPTPKQKLIHVHSGAEELGRVYQPTLAINASPRAFVNALAGLGPVHGASLQRAQTARKDYLSWTEPTQTPGDVNLSEIMVWLRANLPADAIVTNGAGNYSAWVHRFYRYRGFGTGLAPTSGSMGYGTPAGVAAKRVYPSRTVVAFAGDGCYLMHGQELATAVQFGINLIIIVINNSMYGTIRMHQEREYPGRVIATELKNPDFTALAHAYGAFGETVERTEDFADAFARAVAAGKPALIELKTDAEAITPSTTITAIREAAQSKT